MTAFLDTNIVIAMLDPKDKWYEWSVQEVTNSRANGPLLISDVVYCEAGVAMKHQSDLDNAIRRLGFERMPSTEGALFRASVAFKQYRTNRLRSGGGVAPRVLPDMMVGAFADIAGVPLITANPNDFRHYFPSLKLLHPPEV